MKVGGIALGCKVAAALHLSQGVGSSRKMSGCLRDIIPAADLVLYGIVKMASRKMDPAESAAAHSAFLITMEILFVTDSCLFIRKLAVRASNIEHGVSAPAK